MRGGRGSAPEVLRAWGTGAGAGGTLGPVWNVLLFQAVRLAGPCPSGAAMSHVCQIIGHTAGLVRLGSCAPPPRGAPASGRERVFLVSKRGAELGSPNITDSSH